MTGAIEFMQAWREYCREHSCRECRFDVHHLCVTDCVDWSDEHIAYAVKIVMAEKRRRDND